MLISSSVSPKRDCGSKGSPAAAFYCCRVCIPAVMLVKFSEFFQHKYDFVGEVLANAK